MTETIALVTGANKGLGLEISRQLASEGILVVMGARDRQRGEKAVADLRDRGEESRIQFEHVARQDDAQDQQAIPRFESHRASR